MINAAEVLAYRGAKDEMEKSQIEAELYRPPRNETRRRRPSRFKLAEAQSVLAELEKEDRELLGHG